jgi:predicted membrane channel-forming protein YqfA (hemolysin III family)
VTGKHLIILSGIIALFVFSAFCVTILWIQADGTPLDRIGTAVVALFLIPIITLILTSLIHHHWKDTPSQ